MGRAPHCSPLATPPSPAICSGCLSRLAEMAETAREELYASLRKWVHRTRPSIETAFVEAVADADSIACRLYLSPKYSDVTIASRSKKYPAHRIVVCPRSEYLARECDNL